MKNENKIEVRDESPLKWPSGWPRTLINDRKTNGSWKKPYSHYRSAVISELEKMGATSVTFTRHPDSIEKQDPGVAVWFSMAKHNDFAWQAGLHLDSPMPTIAEIDQAFRILAEKHHPDRIAQGSGGDSKVFYKLDEYRKQAKAWILGDNAPKQDSCIPLDVYEQAKMNLAAVRLALSYFRGLERLGMPAIVDRVMTQAFKAQLTDKSVVNL